LRYQQKVWREPPALFVRQAVVARRPGIDLDVVDVGDAAPGQRGAEARIGARDLADQHDVVDTGCAAARRARAASRRPCRREIDARLQDLAVGAVEGADEGLARERTPRPEACHHVLARFGQVMVSNIMPARDRARTDAADARADLVGVSGSSGWLAAGIVRVSVTASGMRDPSTVDAEK
jgi:hypothetical protein